MKGICNIFKTNFRENVARFSCKKSRKTVAQSRALRPKSILHHGGAFCDACELQKPRAVAAHLCARFSARSETSLKKSQAEVSRDFYANFAQNRCAPPSQSITIRADRLFAILEVFESVAWSPRASGNEFATFSKHVFAQISRDFRAKNRVKPSRNRARCVRKAL